MKLNSKKIIAKEFLVLLSVIVITLLMFFCTELYNAFKFHQLDKINSTISFKTKLSKDLAHNYAFKSEKRIWFFKKFSNEFNIIDTKYDTNEKVWGRLEYLAKKDSIKHKIEKEWTSEMTNFIFSLGFSTPLKFKKFIEDNSENSNDINQYKESKRIQIEVKNLEIEKLNLSKEIIIKKDQINIIKYTFIVLVGFFFILRYLFYGVKWSVKILNQN
jgi:hypothetical protein